MIYILQNNLNNKVYAKEKKTWSNVSVKIMTIKNKTAEKYFMNLN